MAPATQSMTITTTTKLSHYRVNLPRLGSGSSSFLDPTFIISTPRTKCLCLTLHTNRGKLSSSPVPLPLSGAKILPTPKQLECSPLETAIKFLITLINLFWNRPLKPFSLQVSNQKLPLKTLPSTKASNQSLSESALPSSPTVPISTYS
jgi:hypothetical protein